MNYFIAYKNEISKPNLDSLKSADIVYVDDKNFIIWFWIEDLYNNEFVDNMSELGIWSRGMDENLYFLLSDVKLTDIYSGIIRVIIDEEKYSKNKNTLKYDNSIFIEWPNIITDLAGLLKNTYEQNFKIIKPIVRKIALYGTLNKENLNRSGSLEGWLKKTSTPNLFLASSYEKIVSNRTHLFNELQNIVIERKIVFLLGGKHSFLENFVEGFESFLNDKPDKNVEQVTVDFSPTIFDAYLNEFRTSRVLKTPRFLYVEMEALLASLSYSALQNIYMKINKPLPGLFEEDMQVDPFVFARIYLELKNNSILDCINHFLNFLSRGVKAAGIHKLTIFLPFNNVEKAINGNDDTRKHLWQGISALKDKLLTDENHSPEIGVVLAMHELPLIEGEARMSIPYSVLLIPALSREEIENLLNLTFGQKLESDIVDSVEEYSGGDPWFLFEIIKCLNEFRVDIVKPKEHIQKACEDIAQLIEEINIDEHKLDEPDKMKMDINDYIISTKDMLSDIIQYFAKSLLKAWKDPDGVVGVRLDINDKTIPELIKSGPIFLQKKGDERGKSLCSLEDYPRYKFSKAGKLPFKCINKIIMHDIQK